MNSGWTYDDVTGIVKLVVLVNNWSRLADQTVFRGTAKPTYVICCHGELLWFRVGQLHDTRFSPKDLDSAAATSQH